MDSGPPSIFSEAPRVKKYIATGCVYYCTFVLGVSMYFLNACILDFSHKFDSDVDTVSKVFTVSFASYLAGALLGGIIMRFINRQFFVMITLTIMTVPIFTYPYTTSMIVFFILGGLNGIGNGGYDCAQVAWIIDIWRHEAAPFILGQHFAFSVGTLVPALIQGPYLTEEEDEVEGQTTTSTTSAPYESKLHIPFTIGGIFFVVGIAVQILLYIFLFRSNKVVSASEDKQKEVEAEKAKVEAEKAKEAALTEIQLVDTKPFLKLPFNITISRSLAKIIMLVFLVCCIQGFYQALETVTSQFIPTFAHFSDVKLSERQGANVAFGVQLGFACGRLAGVILVLKIAPHFLVAGNFCILLATNIILLVKGGSSESWLRGGSIAMGVGMSTVFPAVYAYIEQYLFITDTIASLVAVAGGLVSCIYPIVVGKSVETNPSILPYVNFLSIAVFGVSFAILFYVTRMRGAKTISH